MALPGLGIFTLDKSIVLPEEHDRALLSMPNAVQFQNANIPSADKDLISFICEHTGKITPLAISDLESYLNLGTEMLNIGKPFHLEGIGTITRSKAGKFDFTPGEYTLIRENTDTAEHGKKKVHARDQNPVNTGSAGSSRKLLMILAFAAALFIVGWGGWMMYKKNKPADLDKTSDTGSVVQQTVPAVDSSSTTAGIHDSSKLSKKDTALPPGNKGPEPVNFKFIILATENKPHALRRYNQLRSFDLNIHLHQQDSTFFKVYFQFPALAKDTTRIKDSLRRVYAHEVLIEQ
jgi:hypothetical protein